MENIQLLIDLHKDGYRQGPGSIATTELALSMTGLNSSVPLKVADIGCGTGASTIVLAKNLNAEIIAVDFLPDFLNILKQRSDEHGVADCISCRACSMDCLPFEEGELDLIWSEGAIYNLGFEKGISQWRRHLKPGGFLVASEITWLTSQRPADLQNHWNQEYPEIDTASAKIAILEKNGYCPSGYFVLPQNCWLDEYYGPLKSRFDGFIRRNASSPEALAIVEAEQREIDLYERNHQHVGYGVYIARKL